MKNEDDEYHMNEHAVSTDMENSHSDNAHNENTNGEEANTEDTREEALRALIASGLIAGPDTSIIEEIVAKGKVESDEEECSKGQGGAASINSAREGASTHAPTQEDLVNDARVHEIYTDIISRAPEHKVQPSLERVRRALELMGNPHESYRIVHVTGTNGKTSTTRMIEALLREYGLRTGRFTSPHLTNVRERICIDGQAISRVDFIQTWQDVAPFIALVDEESMQSGGPRLSFFEVLTVMAYAAFAQAPVDVAVMEVGMGGLWDATNVADGDIAVITPIGIDHERWLGSTISQIAHEKAGIIKRGAHVVCAQQKEEARQEIGKRIAQMRAHAREYGHDMHVLSREVAVAGQLLTIRTACALYEDIPLALKGIYQGENAALAISAVEEFFGGKPLDGAILEHAMMSVSSPGRLEVVRSSPTVIVDAAHNPHGAHALMQAVQEYYPGRLVGVVAMMADKDVEGFLGELEPVLSDIVVTGMDSERAMPADDLYEIACDVFGEERVQMEYSLANAIDAAAARAEKNTRDPMTYPAVIVCGSIQLVGQARMLLGKGDADGALAGD